MSNSDFAQLNEFLQHMSVEGNITYNEYQEMMNKFIDGSSIDDLISNKKMENAYESYKTLQYQEAQNKAYNLSLAEDIKKRMIMYQEEIKKLQSELQIAKEDYEAKKAHWDRYRNGEDDPGNPRLKQKADEARQVIDNINEEIKSWEDRYDEDNKNIININKLYS